MDEQVTYSTITIHIQEVNVYTKTTFGHRIKEAFGDSFASLVEEAQDLFIWLIYALPRLVILGVVLFLCRKPFAALKNKLRSKKDKKHDQDNKSV